MRGIGEDVRADVRGAKARQTVDEVAERACDAADDRRTGRTDAGHNAAENATEQSALFDVDSALLYVDGARFNVDSTLVYRCVVGYKGGSQRLSRHDQAQESDPPRSAFEPAAIHG